MTTDEVLDALGRYTKDSKESDRHGDETGYQVSGLFETRRVFVERSCNGGADRNELGPRIGGAFSNAL